MTSLKIPGSLRRTSWLKAPQRLLAESYARARALLEENKAGLESLANALLDRETLDRAEVEAAFNLLPLPPVRVPERVLHVPAPAPAKGPDKPTKNSA